MTLHVIHESRQGIGAAWPTAEAGMQTDRHHLGLALAFAIELVEALRQIGEEILP